MVYVVAEDGESGVTAARAAFDAEISEGLFAMAIAYRNQAALLKKKQKAGPKKNKVSQES